MKVSLHWVKEFTEVKLSVDDLVKKVGAQLGAVEEVIDLGKKYQGIIIAKVVSCEKHPDADKLSVCMIDDGGKAKHVKRDSRGHVQVVCGAPNVRPTLAVAWLPPGVVVPSSFGKDSLVLEAREIRGVVSSGMLASSSELAISDDHEGIVELEVGKPGDDFAEVFKLNDHILDIENKMFTHRPDCFGILGVAREIAGIQNKPFRSPDWYLSSNFKHQTSNIKNSYGLEVKVHDKKLVPRFMAVAVSGIEIKPSPLWLQAHLMRVGIKPINNVVDCTNFYMYLTGQPTHAYDADKLQAVSGKQTGVSLETRKSKKGDKLKLLNGKELTFERDDAILITSNDVPVGVGGVMGGSETEVGTDTKNIILECATFDMYAIRRASMTYGLFTEAVTRFNKGQSPLQNDRVLTHLMQDIVRVAGGQQSTRVIDIHGRLDEPSSIKISAGFINDRLGLKLSLKEIGQLLENVEFKVSTAPADKNHLHIKPPFWRTDIEIPEDIVEEVGRLYGYDHLPLVLPVRSIKPTLQDPRFLFKSKLRDILSRAGASEVLTYSFVHGDLLESVGQDVSQAFELSNAISPDLQYYRLSMIPNLLEKVHPNVKAGYEEFAIFEIGQSHNKNDKNDEGLPKERENLALVIAASDKLKKLGAGYYMAKAYLDHLAIRLGVELRYEPLETEAPLQPGKPFDPKRSARVYLKDDAKPLGMIGEFGQGVLRALKLPVYSAGFEIALGPLMEAGTGMRYAPLSRFPRVEQDMTLKVPADTLFQSLDQKIAEATAEIVDTKAVQIVRAPLDIYEKDGEAHKNITYRFSVTSRERTMTATEINTMLDKLAEAVQAERV